MQCLAQGIASSRFFSISPSQAAQTLGISRKALWEKRRRYGIP